MQGNITTSDTNFQVVDESYSKIEGYSHQFTPDLTWSSSGTTTILFSIESNNNSVIPLRISVNSSSGLLKIDAPNVSSNLEFDFYINSNVTGLSNFVQKIIKLTIDNCNVQNCQKSSNTSISVCSICNIGYNLTSGSWILIVDKIVEPTEIAKHSQQLLNQLLV